MSSSRDWRSTLGDVLRDKINNARVKNPNYSLRAMARSFQIPSSTLSELVNRRKAVSRESAIKLVDRLKMPENTKRYILYKMGETPARERALISSPAVKYLRDPNVVNVLHSLEVPAVDGTVKSIAAFLRVSLANVSEALRVLKELQLISELRPGKYASTGKSFRTTDGISSDDIRAYHAATFDLGRSALAELPPAVRDITSTSFAGSSEKLEEMRAEIRRCHERLVAIGESGPKDQVYRLGISLVPAAPTTQE